MRALQSKIGIQSEVKDRIIKYEMLARILLDACGFDGW